MTVPLLRKIFPEESVNELWESVTSGKGQESKPCPFCHSPMLEVEVSYGFGKDEKTMLDVCTKCPTVWFDRDEFETLPAVVPVKVVNLNHAVQTVQTAAPQKSAGKVQPAKPAVIYENVVERGVREVPDGAWKRVVGFLGLPVECDENKHPRKAWVTWTLAAVSAIVALLTLPEPMPFVERFGFSPGEAFRENGTTLINSFLLHGNLLHLFVNLYFLLMFGDNVEDEIGHSKMFLAVALSFVFGEFLHALAHPGARLSLIGMSAAVSGVLTLFVFLDRRVRLGFMVRVFFIPTWGSLSVSTFIILWILLQVATATCSNGGMVCVSWAAHLGGVIAGSIMWMLVNKHTPVPEKDPNYDTDDWERASQALRERVVRPNAFGEDPSR